MTWWCPVDEARRKNLESIAGAGQKPEDLAAEAIDRLVEARRAAKKRVAEAAFLFDRRNHAR